jgi:hypothetical protein
MQACKHLDSLQPGPMATALSTCKDHQQKSQDAAELKMKCKHFGKLPLRFPADCLLTGIAVE